MMRTIADEMPGHWHKVLAALMEKIEVRDFTLSMVEFAAIAGSAVVVSHQDGGRIMRVRLLPNAEAERLGELFRQGKLRDGEPIEEREA